MNLEKFKIHQETLVGCTQWPILLSEMRCCWDTGVLVSKRDWKEVTCPIQTGNASPLLFFFPSPYSLPFLLCSDFTLSFSTLLENMAGISNSKLRGALLLPWRERPWDRMATQCHSWHKAFPEWQGKKLIQNPAWHWNSSACSLNLKGWGKGQAGSNTLPFPKNSLLLMSRGVSD